MLATLDKMLNLSQSYKSFSQHIPILNIMDGNSDCNSLLLPNQKIEENKDNKVL
jgi:hypothetical protein